MGNYINFQSRIGLRNKKKDETRALFSIVECRILANSSINTPPPKKVSDTVVYTWLQAHEGLYSSSRPNYDMTIETP